MNFSPFKFGGRLLRILPLVCCCATAQATLIEFTVVLSGPAESPPNASPGSGTADIFYDDVTHLLETKISFTGLVGTTTASHIHAATAVPGAGTAGVATQTPTFGGFPLGVTSGTYDNSFNLTLAASFNPAYVTAQGGSVAAAESALVASMMAGTAYLNIHTTAFPGGEIRGFLSKVPDGASTAALLALSLVAILGVTRSRRLNSDRPSTS